MSQFCSSSLENLHVDLELIFLGLFCNLPHKDNNWRQMLAHTQCALCVDVKQDIWFMVRDSNRFGLADMTQQMRLDLLWLKILIMGDGLAMFRGQIQDYCQLCCNLLKIISTIWKMNSGKSSHLPQAPNYWWKETSGGEVQPRASTRALEETPSLSQTLLKTITFFNLKLKKK